MTKDERIKYLEAEAGAVEEKVKKMEREIVMWVKKSGSGSDNTAPEATPLEATALEPTASEATVPEATAKCVKTLEGHCHMVFL